MSCTIFRRPIRTTRMSTSMWLPMRTPYRRRAHRRRPVRMCPRSCHRQLIGIIRACRTAGSSNSNSSSCQLCIFTITYTSETTTSRLTPPAGPASNGELRRSRSVRATGSCSYLECQRFLPFFLFFPSILENSERMQECIVFNDEFFDKFEVDFSIEISIGQLAIENDGFLMEDVSKI